MKMVVPVFHRLEKRDLLFFAPHRARGSSRKTSATGISRILLSYRKKPGSKAWAACFVYLSDSFVTKLPNSAQKQILQKTG